MDDQLTFDNPDKIRHLAKMHLHSLAARPLTSAADDIESMLERHHLQVQELQHTPPEETAIRTKARAILNASRQIERYLNRAVLFARLAQLNDTPPTDFQGLMNRHRQLFNNMIPPEMAFNCAVDPQLPKLAVAEATLMHVLVCLCINANEAMNENGMFTITAEIGEQPTTATPGRARIQVGDTGKGIPPEQQDKLFSAFISTKNSEKHTGLSLFLCRQMLNAGGATIQCIASQPGNTVFELSIPLHKPVKTLHLSLDVNAPVKTPEPETEQEEKNVILVVEDEKALRRLMVRQVLNMGFEVVDADNGREALELLDKEPVHLLLVVTDIMMPEMGGIELVDELRTRYPNLPAVFVSGYIDETFSVRGTPQEYSRYLRKPFVLGALSDKIREMLPA